jgi:hypothetical protein
MLWKAKFLRRHLGIVLVENIASPRRARRGGEKRPCTRPCTTSRPTLRTPGTGCPRHACRLPLCLPCCSTASTPPIPLLFVCASQEIQVVLVFLVLFVVKNLVVQSQLSFIGMAEFSV